MKMTESYVALRPFSRILSPGKSMTSGTDDQFYKTVK